MGTETTSAGSASESSGSVSPQPWPQFPWPPLPWPPFPWPPCPWPWPTPEPVPRFPQPWTSAAAGDLHGIGVRALLRAYEQAKGDPAQFMKNVLMQSQAQRLVSQQDVAQI